MSDHGDAPPRARDGDERERSDRDRDRDRDRNRNDNHEEAVYSDISEDSVVEPPIHRNHENIRDRDGSPESPRASYQPRDRRDKDRDHDRARDSYFPPQPTSPKRGERGDKFDRVDKPDKFDRTDKFDRADKFDRNDKFDRADRADRDRTDRTDRADRDRNDRPDRADRTDRIDRDRDRNRDVDRDRDQYRDRDRDRSTRDQYRDRDRDNHHPRDTHGHDGYHSPRPRDHLRNRDHLRDQPASKRNSITSRLFGSIREVRNKVQDRAGRGGRDPDRGADSDRDSHHTAPIQRRGTSAAAIKQTAVPRVKEWLETCNGDHNHHCAAPTDSAAVTWTPIWLIDVVDRRLVRAENTDRYVALSYVGGSPNRSRPPPAPVQTLRSNIDAFQAALPLEKDLPQTFVDVMWLARKLGLRHLWIDKLCIVQDDPEQVDNNVRHIAFVFANAYMTVVAAAGDAYSGLKSLRPQKSIRNIGKNPRGNTHDQVVASTWNTRAWTLVEGLYSRRCVFFFEDSVAWECHCDSWTGNPTGVMSKLRGGGNAGRHECAKAVAGAAFAFHHAPWPDLDEYARLVMDYSARRLTLADDTLRAFSGITHVLSRSFPGGFVYGMPVMFLDVALLWRPHASMRRRALSKPPFLPSWSWMGWWFDGVPVDVGLWRAAADYVEDAKPLGRRGGGPEPKRVRTANTFRVRPTVTWNMTDRVASAPLLNTGLQYRDVSRRRGSPNDLPVGWHRSGPSFVHDADDESIFRYPVPVEEPPGARDYEPPAGEQALPGPLLSFSTVTGFFEVSHASSLAHRDRSNPAIAVGDIWGKGDAWVGQFRSHDAWLGVQSSNYEGEERLEFVAVSLATARRGSHVFEEDRFDEVMDADENVAVVNVLWVERIGEITYRRGVGHILQKAWDAQARDEVSLLLG